MYIWTYVPRYVEIFTVAICLNRWLQISSAYIDSIDGSNNGLGVAKIVLSVLAIENKNHATYIDLMTRHYNLFDEAECTQLIGRPWTSMQELLSELSEGR
ncbi:MAG: hypothetical protein QXD57_07625 [Ignisphaera sp.]